MSEKPSVPMKQRPGCQFLVPGEYLCPRSKRWTDSQRADGIWVTLFSLTAEEEFEVMGEAQRASALAAVGIFQVRKALGGWADSVSDADGKPAPSEWFSVAHLEKPKFWDDLGMMGRNHCVTRYNEYGTPSPDAREAASGTFRVVT